MKRASLCVLLMLLACPVRAQAVEPAMAKNAILIGWDGAHRDHVKKLLGDGKLPNLQKLIGEGALVNIDVTSGATDTKAGWSQILTGYRPQTTGVYNNARYRDIPEGYSVFERLRAQYGADKIATVAVIGKSGHCGEINAPFKKEYQEPTADEKGRKKNGGLKPGKNGKKKQAQLGRVVEENGAKYLVFEGSPYYTMHKHVDQWHFGLALDERVGNKALEMLDQYGKKPFFFFIHFAEVDHSGHKFGEPSKEYDEAIVSGDQQLGRIIEKLKSMGVYDKTLIYVTADHGFDVGGSGHRNAPYVFLATNDKQISRSGMRVDITPTILDRLGVNTAKLQPPLDGESLAHAATKPIAKPEDNPDLRKPQPKPKAKGPGKGKGKAKQSASL